MTTLLLLLNTATRTFRKIAYGRLPPLFITKCQYLVRQAISLCVCFMCYEKNKDSCWDTQQQVKLWIGLGKAMVLL